MIDRSIYSDRSTIGNLYIDGDLFCRSLELSCRKGDEKGLLAIPPGKYEIKITYSPKFGHETPELFNDILLRRANGDGIRSGIRIHPANEYTELDGCIAPGMKAGVDCIYDSRKAYEPLLQEIKKRLSFGKLYISIIGGGSK